MRFGRNPLPVTVVYSRGAIMRRCSQIKMAVMTPRVMLMAAPR